MTIDHGRSPDGSGSRASHDAASSTASSPEASIPNAARLPWQGGKCRVPMWSMGCPAGFCDEEAYGDQLPKEILGRDRGYAYPYKPIPYCFGPCCPAHGGPKRHEERFFQDGTTEDGHAMWCCVGPNFENLQESPAGFDGNPLAARQNYAREASAIEARRAATAETGAVHESAMLAEQTPHTGRGTSHG